MNPWMNSRIRRCFAESSFMYGLPDRLWNLCSLEQQSRDHPFGCQYPRVPYTILPTGIPAGRRRPPGGWRGLSMGSGLEDIRIPDDGDAPNKRALVIAAHPDDSEFGVAGTAALWARDGWEVYYLICTDGSKGSEDPEMTAEKLVPMRRVDQRAAASVLGVKDVFFLDYVDGELTYTRELIRDVVRQIRKLKPHAVFTHDPNQIVRNLFINHPDHRCAGTVALDAVYPFARNRPSFPELLDEGLEPFSVR